MAEQCMDDFMASATSDAAADYAEAASAPTQVATMLQHATGRESAAQMPPPAADVGPLPVPTWRPRQWPRAAPDNCAEFHFGGQCG